MPAKRLLPVVDPKSPTFALKERMANRRVAHPEPEPAKEPIVKVQILILLRCS